LATPVVVIMEMHELGYHATTEWPR